MERVTERKVNDDPNNNDKYVIAPPGRRGLRTEIAATFGGDAGKNAPGQEGAEQKDRTEIAVRQQMCEGPGFDARQHRMFQPGFYMTWNKRRHDEDRREQHQSYGDVTHEAGRRPQLDPFMRAVLTIAPNDQYKAGERDQRKNAPIDMQTNSRNDVGAHAAQRHKHMGAEEYQQP